jgi:hypothetical protein
MAAFARIAGDPGEQEDRGDRQVDEVGDGGDGDGLVHAPSARAAPESVKPPDGGLLEFDTSQTGRFRRDADHARMDHEEERGTGRPP